MRNDFENFLIDKHGEQYIGTDDCMPDDFNKWLEDRSIDDWIELGNEFAKRKSAELQAITKTDAYNIKLLELFLENTRADVKKLKEINAELLKACKALVRDLGTEVIGHVEQGCNCGRCLTKQAIAKATTD